MTMKIYMNEYTGYAGRPIYLDISKYEFKKNFLCVQTIGGKFICYNLSHIESFEVEEDHGNNADA